MVIKTAFLNGDSYKDIHTKQPEGFADSEKATHVCKL